MKPMLPACETDRQRFTHGVPIRPRDLEPVVVCRLKAYLRRIDPRSFAKRTVDPHTNTVEGLIGLFKRAVYGQFHHVSEAHLRRYLAEADFKYNHRIALGIDDAQRAA